LPKTVAHVSVMLPFITAIVSSWQADWMWLGVSLIGMAVFLVPIYIFGDGPYDYHVRLNIMAAAPPLAYLGLVAASLLFAVPSEDVLGMSIQTGAAMVYGYMIMIGIDNRSETYLSKRWMLLLSIAFACTVSILYTFLLYYYMFTQGYPVVNEDFVVSSPSASNRMLMAPMSVAMLGSVLYAFIIRRVLQHVDKAELVAHRGGA